MNVADIVSAVSGLVSDLGLLPFVFAGAVIAMAAVLYRRIRR